MWIKRHINDEFVAKAKKHGYRSRSAYKLIEMDDKFSIFFSRASVVVDLGSRPGSWSQIALSRVCNNSKVFAIDIEPMQPLDGVTFMQCDFLSDIDSVVDFIGGSADVVISDLAPKACGYKDVDHLRSMSLCDSVILFVTKALSEGGSLIMKFFQGAEDRDLYCKLKDIFGTVKYFKPTMSRKESREMFFICKDYR